MRALLLCLALVCGAASAQSINYMGPATAAGMGALSATSNLSDLVNPSAARANIGLGSMATQSANAVAVTGGSVNGTAIGGTTPGPAVVTNFTHSGPEMDTSIMVLSPLSGASISLQPGTTIINPGATLLTLSAVLPGCNAAANGQIVRFAATKAVTTFSLSAMIGSITGAIATLALGGGNGYICQGATGTWFKLY